MNSFIVRLEDFYRMTKDDRNRMDINKSHYVIPKNYNLLYDTGSSL